MADIVLAARSHLGRRRIADVGIMRPNDRLTAGAVECQQVLQRREHMLVAQIPGRTRTIIHDAIIALGIGDETGVLHRVEKAFAVTLGVGHTVFQ